MCTECSDILLGSFFQETSRYKQQTETTKQLHNHRRRLLIAEDRLFTMVALTLITCHTLAFFLWILAASLYYFRYVYGPTLQVPSDFVLEHPLEACPLTADTLEDLLVDETMSSDKLSEHTKTHGVAFVRQVLSSNTTSKLRNYILKANHEIEGTTVKNNENRFHIIPDPMEPSIRSALKEIGSHAVFRPLVDAVLGNSSSLVSLSVITNLYGAEEQDWHYDTGKSAASYPEYFVPEYTLAIPLQDTTKAMGATGICPGTHHCESLAIDEVAMRGKYREEMGYSLSDADEYDDSFYTWLLYNYPCNISAEVSAGDGFLYSTDLFHRGGAHSDPTSGERVVMFVTFASSRQGPDDNRVLPLGTIHSLGWRGWGHTIDDFLTMESQPWRFWHAWGIVPPSSPTKDSSVRPWTLLDCFLMIFRESNERWYPISDNFHLESFTSYLETFFFWTAASTGAYLFGSQILLILILQGMTGRNEHDTSKVKTE